jgi:hypothetical protein
MVRLIVALTILLVLGLAAEVSGEFGESLRVRCHWQPPATGSTPVHYYLQIQDPRSASSIDTTYVVPHQGGTTRVEQEFIFLDGDFWEHYRARVQAMDAVGRLGPWSPWSDVAVFEIPDPEP